MPKTSLIVSDPKGGKSKAYEIDGTKAQSIIGRTIGEILDGSLLGVPGRIRITGGSDVNGVPMRPDIQGGGVRKVILSEGVGFRPQSDGDRRRKLVRGKMITADAVQINCVIVHEEA